jgi:hypothetical protein
MDLRNIQPVHRIYQIMIEIHLELNQMEHYR